ncbi:collagen alpha-1(XXIII) chain-like [Corticium candelabrum]|uniref:collagen alpha-1(XXIII) chain-like n=1 Tax=Corticium candelabrum TaxID=121492 RepID=UPI002E268526|nr:collagen alpha-1(XXIII) chain-like [Corticium candelabrum]
MKGSHDQHLPATPKCRWFFALFTVTALTLNLAFTTICFISLRDLKSHVTTLQDDLTTLQEQQSAAGDVRDRVSRMLSEPEGGKKKRSAASLDVSSQIAGDLGSAIVSTIKSICKPESAVCLPGAKGEVGEPGKSGLPGRDGIGQPGVNGLPGLSGRDGRDGRDGEPGDDGKPGVPGVKGEKGVNGTKGDVGRRGVKGIRGIQGEKGKRGVKGRQGHKGNNGSQGVTGDQGLKGERGEKGIQGEKGTKGERGMKGEPGIQGEKGMKGEPGSEDIPEDGTIEPTIGSEIIKLPSQCNETNHRVLSDTWRQSSLSSIEVGFHCDSEDNGFRHEWHAFNASIGRRMAKKCPSNGHCGTATPGWLKKYPLTAVGDTGIGKVCFRWLDNCCALQVTINITNCGDFYVYNLPVTETCPSAYCSDA